MARRTLIRVVAVAVGALLVASIAGCAGRTATSGGGETSIGSGYQYGAPSVAPAPSTDGGALSGDQSKDSAGGRSSASAPGDAGEKLIVINKTIRIETADVDKAIARIRELAQRDGGDISNMQVSTSNDEPIYPQPVDKSGGYATDTSTELKAFVTVRVPNAKFTTFVADVAKLGKVLYQAQNTDDVTQQHVDMQARLANMKAEEARLRELFNKANKVSDMLAIEQELTRVQGEIESMSAQIAYLENQAALATVNIELKEPTPVVSPGGIDWGVRTAFTDSVRAFVDTMNGIIVMLGPVIALLVFVVAPVWLVVWLVRRWLRTNRQRAASRAAETDANAGGSDR
jgi:uncharacterized protein YdcH (DUF465 family)